ncbi:antitoxin Xre/MbcA/ParS toxin-binding domain-containing protein [Flavobacterium sp. '19STA2R22 D10 B1']|uniref:type II RES/Xre toxin-antitoxin system antitoxin n=1 Tax=Flavobacterium aerium TaxID=3037261 RepID=UPI00278BEAD9|nr:antitoxin Xre/MbcA/ParS toxin-binding domain-containing protein [Flavobacterium sp. '19STA2R22 D10 B1']
MVHAIQKSNSDLDKAVRVFVRKVEKDRDYKVINNNITYNELLSSPMLIVHSIREGVPFNLFKLIKQVTPFSEDDWANFLNISKKSLQRYRDADGYIFKPIHSEKIFELAEVTNLGKEVFDDVEKFYLWLNTPNYGLGNLKPTELLRDSYGKDLVIKELHNIDQGIFA